VQAPDLNGTGNLSGMTLASTLGVPGPASSTGLAGGLLSSTSPLTAAGGVGVPAVPSRLGYLRLSSFTQNAAVDLQKAITSLEVRPTAGLCSCRWLQKHAAVLVQESSLPMWQSE